MGYRYGTETGTILTVATNLRLRPEAESALREAAERLGRSQQELIREAVNNYLGVSREGADRRPPDPLRAAGIVRAPREPFRRARRLLDLPGGITTEGLLDRGERL